MRARSISAASVCALAVLAVLVGCDQQLAPPSASMTSVDASALATATIGTLAKPKPAPMGSPSTSGAWRLVVESATRSRAAAGVQAAEGRELLVVTSELTNGGRASCEVTSSCFVLADEGGRVHRPTPTNDLHFLYDQTITLRPGATTRVVIAYAIPVGVGPFTWTFTPPDRPSDAQAPAVLEIK